MKDSIKRDDVEHRVLVELAGQDRAMTLKELYDELGLAPESLHHIINNLRYADTPYVKTVCNYPGDDGFRITWEGEELLRRIDEAHANPTVTYTKQEPPWLLRRCNYTRFAVLVMWLTALVIGLECGMMLGR